MRSRALNAEATARGSVSAYLGWGTGPACWAGAVVADGTGNGVAWWWWSRGGGGDVEVKEQWEDEEIHDCALRSLYYVLSLLKFDWFDKLDGAG